MSVQVITAIISYTWLFLVLLLLFLIWRNSVQTQKAQQVLSSVALKNAEAVQVTAEAARALARRVEALEKL